MIKADVIVEQEIIEPRYAAEAWTEMDLRLMPPIDEGSVAFSQHQGEAADQQKLP